MRKIIFLIISLFALIFVTACSDIPVKPVIDNDIKTVLNSIVTESSKIGELYYEEVPETAVYSGGVKIENISKVWLKDSTLKTELAINFYKDDVLLYTETVGELYDYNSFDNIKYYIGPYPEQAKLHIVDFQDGFSLPRDQTILWYLDRTVFDLYTVSEGVHEGEQCLVVEILKNSSGSTHVWISIEFGLPVKIVNNYNGNTTVREYHSFKIGEGAVPANILTIPPHALTF